jgi:hypothetical protein
MLYAVMIPRRSQRERPELFEVLGHIAERAAFCGFMLMVGIQIGRTLGATP